MGPIEEALIERVKEAKTALYGGPTRTEPQRYYTVQPCSPDCAWALAMRRDGIRKVTIDGVIAAICARFDITKCELLSGRRSRGIARPRQIAMYLSRLLTKRSLPEIGRRFGNRDHTTVLHAVRRIAELCRDDAELSRTIDVIGVDLAGADYWKAKRNI